MDRLKSPSGKEVNLLNRGMIDRKEPPNGFWEEYLPKLEERIAKEDARIPHSKVIWWRKLNAQHGWAIRMAAAIAFVSVGILIGRYFSQQPVQQSAIVKSTPSETIQTVTASPDVRALRYLKRSEVLLLGLVNYEPATSEYSPNLSRKKEISRELIQEASLLKQELNSPDQRRLKELVSDLELILAQIANLEEKSDLPQIELVKSGVDRKGILLKINLEEMRMHESAPGKTVKGASGQPEI